MSNSKNKAVIGAFVVGAVTLAIVGVLVLGGGEFFKKKITHVLYFDRSVKGLKAGSPVVFQGVEIGTVKEIPVRVNIEDWEFQVPVIIEIDPSIYRDPNIKLDQEKLIPLLVEKGLRAKLELQSMVTGQLQVDLSFMPDTKARLVGGDLPYTEIPTTASGMEKFTTQFKDLPLKEAIGNLSATLLSIKDFVDNPELKESVHNLNQTLQDINQLAQHIDTELVGAAKKTIANIDELVVDVEKEIKPLVRKFGGMADSIKATSDTARPAIKTAGQAFANIESMTRKGSDERKKLEDMIKQLSAAARSIKNWADYLERHPEALIRGKGNPRQRR